MTSKRVRVGLMLCSLLAVSLLVGSISAQSRAATKATKTAVTLDVLVAIDTTGSMTGSITQAQADARDLVTGIQARYPTAAFAVAQFRDMGDTPEYQLMQAMTSDATTIDTAIAGFTAAGGGDYPEAINLVYQNALDPANGWRAGDRKLLVVISDAEPHGAGTSGFAGCADTSVDPHGLSTSTTLANLKTAGVTVLMVRQAATASASLQCYQSLSSASYPIGAAKDSGSTLVDVVEAMIFKAVNTAGSPLGKWKLSHRIYRWVKLGTGFEERSMTPHKLTHGCLVRKGAAVDRYYLQKSGNYKVAYKYWYTRRGGAGKRGTNCYTRWKKPKAIVKIVVNSTSTQMTLSCDNKPGKACYFYKKVR